MRGAEGRRPAGALVLLGLAPLPPGQLIVDVGAEAGPEKEARQQDEDQQDHQRVRAQASPEPRGHARPSPGVRRGRGGARGRSERGNPRPGPREGCSLLPRWGAGRGGLAPTPGLPGGCEAGWRGSRPPRSRGPGAIHAARGPGADNGRIVERPGREAARAPLSAGAPLASADVTPRRLRRQLRGEAGHLLRRFQPPTPALPARTQSGPFSAQLAITRRRRRRGRAGAGGKEGARGDGEGSGGRDRSPGVGRAARSQQRPTPRGPLSPSR